jgi:hypothetical protein
LRKEGLTKVKNKVWFLSRVKIMLSVENMVLYRRLDTMFSGEKFIFLLDAILVSRYKKNRIKSGMQYSTYKISGSTNNRYRRV